jgi:4-hydroxybenzoate polyprenyltransferase
MLAALAIVADLGVERLSPQTQLPTIRGSRASTRFVLAAIAAGFTALKFLLHIHFSLFGWGFYVTIVVAAALVYVAWQVSQGHSVMPSGPAVRAGSSGRSSDPPAGPPPTAP